MAFRTILLKGRGFREERPAGGTITPGMLLLLNSSNQYVAFNVSVDANRRAAIFATEDDFHGLGIDDNYLVNDNVQGEVCTPGMWVNALLQTSAAAIVIGDLLETLTGGFLQKRTSGAAVAMAAVAVNNSSASTTARIQAIIL